MTQIPNTQKVAKETMQVWMTKRFQIHQSKTENKHIATSTKQVNKSTIKTTDNKGKISQITETKKETTTRVHAQNERWPKMKKQTTETTSTLKPIDKTRHKRNMTNGSTTLNMNTLTNHSITHTTAKQKINRSEGIPKRQKTNAQLSMNIFL